MPALPPLTAEDRTAALEKARVARKERSDLKGRVKRGSVTLAEVFETAASDAAIAKMKVTELIEAMPGVGPVSRAQIMERLGIADSRRVRGLGERQRAALELEFAA